ncbi:MAG: DNA ligase [Desulfobacteraceae bacterium]|nr:DNA ligase [Desulfobacteraceae bacterium]
MLPEDLDLNLPDVLASVLEKYNRAYRSGKSLISDLEYDRLLERLRELNPSHTFLRTVEPEKFDGKKQVRHPEPMLSTEKAYTSEQLDRYVRRVIKEAADIGISAVTFRATAKLDGLAGRDDGTIFASRGNGTEGYEISSAFEKGVIPIGGRGRGVGEIVILKSYFEKNLSHLFEHPRNMVVGIVSSDIVNENARQALDDGVVHFVPYVMLDKWTGSGEDLIDHIETIVEELTRDTDYPVDGVVVEVENETLKAAMGATAHHYRWQIAIKSKGDTAFTRVVEVVWQVGRTGTITPVMVVEPVSLSGATIRRVTAHNAGNVQKQKIGVGAQIEIIRSGEVIPKLEHVHTPATDVPLISHCPSCDGPLEWSNDFLKCVNFNCPAQVEQRLYHWFNTLGTADWFGIKTIQKLVQNGYTRLEEIYGMTEADFVDIGFGPVQSENLAAALQTSKSRRVEDWRFLAAFGISDLGKGDSRKLLSHLPLDTLLKVDAGAIKSIKGFGDNTSKSIAKGVAEIADTITHMLDLGFILEKTPTLAQQTAIGGPLSGKAIVFTGKMKHGDRDLMKKEALRLGARVQTSVSGATDYLICGEKVGASKIKKAEASGIKILSEEEYFNLIKV